MSPKAQRIAIAEACGWRPVKDSGFTCRVWENGITGAEAFNIDGLPDYLTDLNAMHEAEKVLIAMGDDNCDGCGTSTFDCYLSRISRCATAAQRAEAFLRATGRWEEGR